MKTKLLLRVCLFMIIFTVLCSGLWQPVDAASLEVNGVLEQGVISKSESINEDRVREVITQSAPDDVKEVHRVPFVIKNNAVVTPRQSSPPGVALNFDNANIHGVIKIIADLIKIDYLIDPAVKGTVNIHTQGKISKKDLMDVFLTILKVNGAAGIKEGELFHIVPIQSVKSRMIMLKVGRGEEDVAPNDSVVVQVIPLKYLSANEVSQIIKPLITPGAEITAFEKNRLLLITDFATNVSKLQRIVELIDVNIFQEVKLRIYPIKEADVQEIAKDMQKIFAALEVSTKTGRGAGVNFIPISRINSLLVISSMPLVFDEITKWLDELDRNISQDEMRTYVYHVKNGIAGELSDILNAVYVQSKSKKSVLKVKPQPSRGVKNLAAGGSPQKVGLSSTSSATNAIVGEVKFIPYPTTNTIIIKSTPRDYVIVKKVLNELDIIPRQVLIEIMIAEVTLDENVNLGIEYSFFDDEIEAGVKKGIIGSDFNLSKAGTLATGGFTASGVSGDFLGTINALASENKINILASPHIIATDGKEASIDIGDEVPLVTSKIFINDREELTIERRNTGVILSVSPHINTTGLITLDLSLELSNASQALVEGEADIRIFQRSAKTTMVIQDQQTIIIGGLIDEKIEKEVSKVPFLGDVPLLGFLFRHHVDRLKKTELILLITPKVIRDLNDAKDVTDEFIEKLMELKQHIKAVVPVISEG